MSLLLSLQLTPILYRIFRTEPPDPEAVGFAEQAGCSGCAGRTGPAPSSNSVRPLQTDLPPRGHVGAAISRDPLQC